MPVGIDALEPVARIVVATLFNSLWEAALLALLVALILRIFPNLNATTRYAMWCIALVGSLLLPVATALPQISVEHASAMHRSGAQKHIPVQTHASQPAQVTREAPAQSASRPAFRLPDRLQFTLPQYVALGLFIVWAFATLAMLIRLGVNLWRLERLKTDALPLPVDYRDRLARWSAAEKGGRDVRLCICDRIDVPVAVGLFDSMILIPQHLLESLSQEEMDQIMLHELAHLRRADDWTNGVQRVIQALFFFNPAVLYIAQQLDVEREVACDDWVVHETREVRPYATCLTKMAEVTAWPHRALAAPGVFVTRRGLSVRVERLLRAGRNVRTSVAFGPAGGAVAALVVLFFIMQTVAPSFAFTLPQSHLASVITAPAPKPVVHPVAKSSAKPVETKPAEHKTIAYVIHSDEKATAAPAPAVPAPVVKAPVQRVNVKHVAIPQNPVLPPDFAKNVQTITSKSIHQAINGSLGAAHMQNANCIGCDYSGQNLSGHNFRNQRMNGADFSKANLQNADFSGAVLVGADFSGANLRGASFSHAVLTGCDLRSADVTGVNFDGAQVTGCDVNAKALSPHQAATLLHTCHSGCDFSGANLQNQDLHGLSVTGVDLTDADLRGANLSGVNFSGVDFSGARIDGANVDGARFTGCDFSGVDLHNVDMSKAMVVGTRFDR